MNDKHEVAFEQKPGMAVKATPGLPAPKVESENSLDADSISIHLSEADNTEQYLG